MIGGSVLVQAAALGSAWLLCAFAASIATASEILNRSRQLASEIEADAQVRVRTLTDVRLTKGHDALGDARQTLNELPPVVLERAATAAAVAVLDALVERLNSSRPDRAALSRRGFSFVADLAAPREGQGPRLRRYGEVSPRSTVPLPVRVVWARFGGFLDDIRLINDLELEWWAVLWTMWARAAALLLAPLLPQLAVGPVPFEGGTTWVNGIWALATLMALVTAIGAPSMARLMLERTTPAQSRRHRMMLAEAPVALALIVGSPTWLTAVFAIAFMNWSQRNSRPAGEDAEFAPGRYLAFLTSVIAAQTIGLVLAGAFGWAAVAEMVLLTVPALLLTSGSYGMVLPLTLLTAGRLAWANIRNGAAVSLRARRVLREQMVALRTAADDLEEDDAQAAVELRRAARGLAVPVRVQVRRWLAATATRRDLETIVTRAMVEADVLWADDPALDYENARADREGNSRPAFFFEPDFAPTIERETLLRRRDAIYLGLAIRVMVREARHHGTGLGSVLVSTVDDQLEIRVAAAQASDRVAGFGGGRELLDSLEAQLPGCRISGGPVAGDWANQLPRTRLWGQQLVVSFEVFA